MARAMNQRLKTGLGIGALAFALASGAHFMNASGMLADFLRQGAEYPGLPGVTASHGSLFLRCMLVALPLALVVGLGAMLRRLLACLGYLGMWFWGLSSLGRLFVPAGGDPWLLWHPGLTPVIGFVGAAVIFLIMDTERR